MLKLAIQFSYKNRWDSGPLWESYIKLGPTNNVHINLKKWKLEKVQHKETVKKLIFLQ